jgi:uncharacterized pyridoxamine 5'-phosphate oxidase family protein
MGASARDLEFVQDKHGAAMITVARDGMPKVARVGVAWVDGKLWSSATGDRVRTKRLRRDPRCTLYLPDDAFTWVALETVVSILDGPEVPELSLKLFRVMQDKPSGPVSWFGKELDDEALLAAMVEEGRVIYEFDIQKSYGLH